MEGMRNLGRATAVLLLLATACHESGGGSKGPSMGEWFKTFTAKSAENAAKPAALPKVGKPPKVEKPVVVRPFKPQPSRGPSVVKPLKVEPSRGPAARKPLSLQPTPLGPYAPEHKFSLGLKGPESNPRTGQSPSGNSWWHTWFGKQER